MVKKLIRIALYAFAALLIFPVQAGFAQDSKAGHDHGSMESASSKGRVFHVALIEYQGTKIWVPGTLIVKKGEQVKVHLINNMKPDPKDPNNPNVHGYAIDEYGVKASVASGKSEMVSFTADKAGLFRIYCQLHPAHIGGQILVLEK